jgi:chromosome segregation ATPase
MDDPSTELFHIEEFPAYGELRLESVNANLAQAEAALEEKRRAFADSAQRRAEIEAKLEEARAAYAAEREAREKTESLAHGYEVAETFAASVRSEADRNGEHDRAQQERMVQERAAYEATLFRARSSQQRENEERLEAERLDFERRLADELERQASLGRECESAEAAASALRVQIASTHAEAAKRIATEQAKPAPAPRVADDERKRRDLKARIAQLSAAERVAAQERAEAERLLAALDEAPQAAAPPKPEPQPQPSKPNAKPIVDATVVAVAETILGLFSRRPSKK